MFETFILNKLGLRKQYRKKLEQNSWKYKLSWLKIWIDKSKWLQRHLECNNQGILYKKKQDKHWKIKKKLNRREKT